MIATDFNKKINIVNPIEKNNLKEYEYILDHITGDLY